MENAEREIGLEAGDIALQNSQVWLEKHYIHFDRASTLRAKAYSAQRADGSAEDIGFCRVPDHGARPIGKSLQDLVFADLVSW